MLLHALLLLWWCRLPWFVFLPALMPVLSYAAFEWRRLGLVRGRLATRERRWFWWPEAGEDEEEFTFRGELVLWSWLLVIEGRLEDGRRLRLVLARDSMGAEEWRRLQVALRYSRCCVIPGSGA